MKWEDINDTKANTIMTVGWCFWIVSMMILVMCGLMELAVDPVFVITIAGILFLNGFVFVGIAEHARGLNREREAHRRTGWLKEAFVESLAALEHEQWIYWSKGIAAAENISPERLERWKKLWVPYDRLSEEDKEQDRRWARKVLKIKIPRR